MGGERGCEWGWEGGVGGGCLEGKVRESGGADGGCLEGKVRESGAYVCTGTRNVYANHHEMGRQVWFMRQVVRKKLCAGGGVYS